MHLYNFTINITQDNRPGEIFCNEMGILEPTNPNYILLARTLNYRNSQEIITYMAGLMNCSPRRVVNTINESAYSFLGFVSDFTLIELRFIAQRGISETNLVNRHLLFADLIQFDFIGHWRLRNINSLNNRNQLLMADFYNRFVENDQINVTNNDSENEQVNNQNKIASLEVVNETELNVTGMLTEAVNHVFEVQNPTNFTRELNELPRISETCDVENLGRPKKAIKVERLPGELNSSEVGDSSNFSEDLF